MPKHRPSPEETERAADAYEEGRQAHNDGRSTRANPYATDTVEAWFWFSGWCWRNWEVCEMGLLERINPTGD